MANTHSIDLERGSTQYLSQADAGTISGNVSFEFWVKLESAPASGEDMYLFKCGDRNNSPYVNYGANYVNEGGVFKLQFYRDRGGVAFGRIIANQTLTVGTWYHIAMTYDGTTLRGYVNGTELITGALSGNGSSAAAEFLWLGRGEENIGTGVYFDGLIDDFRQWSDQRTQTEIDDNKSLELVGDETNLVGYWKLNNDLTDETTGARTLTNNNSAVFSTTVAFAAAGGGAVTPTPTLLTLNCG